MPQRKAQMKSLKQNKKRNEINSSSMSALKTALKKVSAAIEKKDVAEAQKCYASAQQLIDKAAKKNLIKENKAARDKSRICKRINAIKTA